MMRVWVTLARLAARNNNCAAKATTGAIHAHQYRWFADDVSRQLLTPLEKKRKIIETEVAYWHASEETSPDPATIQPDDWAYLLQLETFSARKRYCYFLFRKDEAKRGAREKKEVQRLAARKHQEEIKEKKKQNTHIYYGLGGNALLMRIRPTTIRNWGNRKLMRARLYGPKLIFDCSFDATMSDEELKSAGRQLQRCYAENRRHKKPFDLHLCNVDLDTSGGTLHWLQKHIPNVLDKSCLLSIHTECCTDLFPVERLVYLSPDSDNTLTDYNADDIFIVGTIVDKGPCQKLSLAQAKRMGVRHARLPLESHLRLASGAGKRFTLNAMTAILLTWKQTNSWKEALSVPHLHRKRATD